MARKAGYVKQGDLPGNRTVFMGCDPEEPPGRSQSVHSSGRIDDAGKRRNGRGAKGRREMDS
jgi:hypothetical protein